MSKPKARKRRKSPAPPVKRTRQRQRVMAVVLILMLSITGLILAQWRSLRTAFVSPAPVPQTSSPQLAKEYIYAGGKLVATEEPITSASIPANAATFISQTVPSAMTVGQSYNVSVTMKNTGSNTWTAAAAYGLGAQNPQDSTIWRTPSRVELPSSVAPNSEATFSFSVTAPSTVGTYNFQWKMVQNGIEWFGDISPNVSVTVTNSAAPTTENVVWTNSVGVTVNGNSLSKTTDWGWGNSGASSTKAISSGDGYAEFTVWDANSSISMLGLNNGDSNQDYTDIDYGLHPAGSGTLYVYENGISRGAVGPYAAGDKLRVAVEGGVVKYRRNGALIYTSAVAPTYPLSVDTAFYSPNATVSDVAISGQLQTAGNPENVVWTNTVGVSVSGNSLTKTVDWGWGNSGASSTRAISAGDGYVEYTIIDSNSSISMLGLNNEDSNQDYTDIDYGFHPAGSGTLYVYENGTPKGSVGPYAAGDKLRIVVQGGVVRYLRNGVEVYKSTVSPTFPLRADTAFYSPGAVVSNVVISGQLQ
jgi:hypothetical protein